MFTQKLSIRPVRLEDLVFLEKIERAAHAVPWTNKNFHDAYKAGYHIFCCKIGENIRGFIISMIVLNELSILNISVLPNWFRCGIGSALLTYTHKFALVRGVSIVFLEVNQNNESAQSFYRAHGYIECARRKDYYRTASGHREDALIFRRLLSS